MQSQDSHGRHHYFSSANYYTAASSRIFADRSPARTKTSEASVLGSDLSNRQRKRVSHRAADRASWNCKGHKVIKCNLGEPDFPLAKHIADEIKRQIDLDLTHYCDPQGILPLREAIARVDLAHAQDRSLARIASSSFPAANRPSV